MADYGLTSLRLREDPDYVDPCLPADGDAAAGGDVPGPAILSLARQKGGPVVPIVMVLEDREGELTACGNMKAAGLVGKAKKTPVRDSLSEGDRSGVVSLHAYENDGESTKECRIIHLNEDTLARPVKLTTANVL